MSSLQASVVELAVQLAAAAAGALLSSADEQLAKQHHIQSHSANGHQ